MKNFVILSLSMLFLSVIFSCEKTEEKRLTLVKTESGGCNGQFNENEIMILTDQEDVVEFSVRNDTLDIYVGIPYICCAPFTSDASISNESIIINVTDTCSNPYESCYCRCMCYYTWNFLFVDFEEKEYSYKIILNDPRETNPVIIEEGTVDIGELN
ncbi:MAG: hypothetical protein JW894_04515 [Bacteroidales bacterium]|nr:hypothetical protein [Bacteroidales bacterium]